MSYMEKVSNNTSIVVSHVYFQVLLVLCTMSCSLFILSLSFFFLFLSLPLSLPFFLPFFIPFFFSVNIKTLTKIYFIYKFWNISSK